MEHFAIGTVSFMFAVIFPVLYFVVFQVRRLGAWSKRAEGPKDRIGFFLFVAVIFGFIAGSLAQPLWSKATECKAENQPVLSCVLFPR